MLVLYYNIMYVWSNMLQLDHFFCRISRIKIPTWNFERIKFSQVLFDGIEYLTFVGMNILKTAQSGLEAASWKMLWEIDASKMLNKSSEITINMSKALWKYL